MNYDLTKELQDAGFPGVIVQIDALGDKFGTLFRVGSLMEEVEGLPAGEPGWAAQNYISTILVYGRTPEETLARLWLAEHNLASVGE